MLVADNIDASSLPILLLKVRLLPVFKGKSPVAAVTNVGKQVVSVDSSTTVISLAVPPPPLTVALTILLLESTVSYTHLTLPTICSV